MDYRVVVELYGDKIPKDGDTTAIGANGLPLNVVGKIELPVKLGSFQQDHASVYCGQEPVCGLPTGSRLFGAQ